MLNNHLMKKHNNINNKFTQLSITGTNYFGIFSEPYSDKIFIIGELNWKDVINNQINSLS